MYSALLFLHSWVRWAVVFGLVLTVVIAITGMTKKQPPQPDDVKKVRLAAVMLDVQVLLGLILYVGVSPITQTAFSNMGAAMKDPVLRFWAVEHMTAMVLGAVFMRVGAVLFKKGTEPKAYRTLLILSVLAVILVFAAIPWPSRVVGRELFRF